ncbi:DNA primase [Aurantimicrobium minutum]|uniref:DNA primase n=1 Tax=Aurantimicrobium minutum TaxID=708131 RepID=UPI0024075638|nr:DNA primase [Aurantimicrobium minutum]MDF9810464.1 DNA primase [Aurantimicrobium minutum]
MAGRIRQADVEELKQRVNIADVIGDYVTLKSAGVGSMKGLCPFHDERSPSFHVRPTVGYFHCFGCGESGDVYTFVQKMDHLSFTESIERLAQRINFELHYEEGSGKPNESGNRSRILAANTAAAEFFVAQLATPGAAEGRKFLGERGFDKAAAEHFGIGYAPKAWNELRDHLKTKGFTEEEQLQAGLLSQGDKGVYDRFRGRVIWPIRDVTGQTIGFGARKLFDDDQGPKYLNTPETPVYHKQQVLYGLDLAKRDVSKTRRVVVVEGYTDVMAAHLSGVTTAVATCGTSFGVEHIKLIRRIMGDDSGLGEVIFTFDPDAAGQKAAMRAFAEEQRFAAQTFVAVAPEGLDPCDLRLARGEQAVRDLMDAKVPMFEFVIRQMLKNYNLDTVEGRVAALREAAPVVADIRDSALRPGYTRELARLTGVDVSEAQVAVSNAVKSSRSKGMQTTAEGARQGYAGPSTARPAGAPGTPEDPANIAPVEPEGPRVFELKNDPSTRLERDAMMALIQYPELVGLELAADAVQSAIMDANLATVRDAIGANVNELGGETWLDRIQNDLPHDFKPLVTQLAVAPLPQKNAEQTQSYCRGVVISLIERDLVRRKSELVGRLQRTSVDQGEVSREIQRELLELETKRRSLRED